MDDKNIRGFLKSLSTDYKNKNIHFNKVSINKLTKLIKANEISQIIFDVNKTYKMGDIIIFRDEGVFNLDNFRIAQFEIISVENNYTDIVEGLNDDYSLIFMSKIQSLDIDFTDILNFAETL